MDGPIHKRIFPYVRLLPRTPNFPVMIYPAHLLLNTARKCVKFVIVQRIQVFCDVVLCRWVSGSRWVPPSSGLNGSKRPAECFLNCSTLKVLSSPGSYAVVIGRQETFN